MDTVTETALAIAKKIVEEHGGEIQRQPPMVGAPSRARARRRGVKYGFAHVTVWR